MFLLESRKDRKVSKVRKKKKAFIAFLCLTIDLLNDVKQFTCNTLFFIFG
jgi:hypothetical protein